MNCSGRSGNSPTNLTLVNSPDFIRDQTECWRSCSYVGWNYYMKWTQEAQGVQWPDIPFRTKAFISLTSGELAASSSQPSPLPQTALSQSIMGVFSENRNWNWIWDARYSLKINTCKGQAAEAGRRRERSQTVMQAWQADTVLCSKCYLSRVPSWARRAEFYTTILLSHLQAAPRKLWPQMKQFSVAEADRPWTSWQLEAICWKHFLQLRRWTLQLHLYHRKKLPTQGQPTSNSR